MAELYETCGHSHGPGHSHGAAEAAPAPAHSPSVPAAVAPPSSVPETSLALEFSRAQQLYQHIDTGEGECELHSVPKHVDDALRAFLRCDVAVRRERVFSANEELEDIHTELLQYLLIDHYIASLRQRLMDKRADQLKLSRVGHEAFLERCLRLGILPATEADMYPLDGEHKVDGNALRQHKIDRFKRNAVAKKRLAELAAIGAARAAAIKKAGGEETDGVSSTLSAAGGTMDEEARREHVLLTLQVACRQSADDILSINQELPLLAHRAALEAAAASGDGHASRGGSSAGGASGAGSAASARMTGVAASGGAGGRSPASEAEDPRLPHRSRFGGPAQFAGGPPPDDISIQPDRPGLQITRIDPTFAIKREVVKAGVFDLDHRPPTMTLEEWGEVVADKTRAREARVKE